MMTIFDARSANSRRRGDHGTPVTDEHSPIRRWLEGAVLSQVSNLIALVAISANAQNQPLVFQSAATQTALLEIFTSEGCSSCPPAETLLTSLKASPGLWKDFVPVAFHVDYWDDLGWRDRWSSREFSDRQRAYATAWANTSVYTPGFVLNGKECRDWSRLTELLKSAGLPLAAC